MAQNVLHETQELQNYFYNFLGFMQNNKLTNGQHLYIQHINNVQFQSLTYWQVIVARNIL
jgi:hypothetical protein